MCGKSSQNSSKPVQMSVYTLLKVVSYYDLSVLSMSVMVSKVWMGWVGGVSSIQVFLDFLNFFNFAKPLSNVNFNEIICFITT